MCVRWPHHAGSTPDVCGGAVTCADQDFDGTVLSRLDVLGKVLVLYEEELVLLCRCKCTVISNHQQKKPSGCSFFISSLL